MSRALPKRSSRAGGTQRAGAVHQSPPRLQGVSGLKPRNDVSPPRRHAVAGLVLGALSALLPLTRAHAAGQSQTSPPAPAMAPPAATAPAPTPTPPNQKVVAVRATQTNNHLANDNLRILHLQLGRILASLHPSSLLLLQFKIPTHLTKIIPRKVRAHLPQSLTLTLTLDPNLSPNPGGMQLENPPAAAMVRSKHQNKTKPPRDRNPHHP